MLTDLILALGVLAGSAAAKGAFIVWSGGGEAPYFTSPSDVIASGNTVMMWVSPSRRRQEGQLTARSPKRFDFFGAQPWTWDQTPGKASRFELNGDTGLCLALRGEAKVDADFQIIECDKAPLWSLAKVDEHGSRIKLDGTGMSTTGSELTDRLLRRENRTVRCRAQDVLPGRPRRRCQPGFPGPVFGVTLRRRLLFGSRSDA